MFLPKDTQRQKISGVEIRTSNYEKYCVTDDNFGNRKFYGLIEESHSRFDVAVSGEAQTGLDICEEYTVNPYKYAFLKVQTKLTEAGENIKKYRSELDFESCLGAYEKALLVMNTLHNSFVYDSAATQIHETAENALALGRGVCQDYTHIMLSLLREEGIPARYVVGMMIGEGASHAWVEALCNGCWYGFDPTNNKLVNDEYIRVSCGRDSSDCSVIRGKFYGYVTQRQTETVTVEEKEG